MVVSPFLNQPHHIQPFPHPSGFLRHSVSTPAPHYPTSMHAQMCTGCRRIWQLLRREGLCVNHKRVYRIYHLNGLGVKRRRRREGLATERLPLLRPAGPNLTWSMDFVMDALASGRRIKCLTCVDDFTKECLTISVAFGITGVQVSRVLDSVALFRG